MHDNLSASQQDVHRALCGKHTAVAVLDLGNDVAFIARDDAGQVEHAVVVNYGGIELSPVDALQRLIAARALAQQQETQATEALRGALVAFRRAGTPVNVRKLARDTGIARSTIYEWLDDEHIVEEDEPGDSTVAPGTVVDEPAP